MSATSRLERLDERSADKGVNTRRHATRVPLYNSFADDGFDFRDHKTPPAVVAQFAPKATTRDVEFWRRAGTGRAAPTPAPCTALALYTPPVKLATLIELPPPCGIDSREYRRLQALGIDAFEDYLTGVRYRVWANKNTAVKAV